MELGGEGLGFDEAFRHQHILANKNQIGNHDSDRPEQHLWKVEHDEPRGRDRRHKPVLFTRPIVPLLLLRHGLNDQFPHRHIHYG